MFLRFGSLLTVAACVVSACLSTPTAVPTPRLATPTSTRSPQPTAAVGEISLPAPRLLGPMSLEETLAKRRSVREFTAQPLSMDQISQLLWACQGTTHPAGLRTAPSAGALYPLEVYVVTPTGVFHYLPNNHRLRTVSQGDARAALATAAVGQQSVAQAAAVFVIAAVYQRTAQKYGERAPLYVHLEAGHAAQNLLLQAVALGLGGVPIGAMYEAAVQKASLLPADHQPVYIVAIGYPAP